MKYIKLIIITVFLSTAFTGCSYVSDYVEGAITDRASFGVKAEYITATDEVELTWDKTDSGSDFAGIEIYRTSEENDEYATYELVANRFPSNTDLASGLTTNYTVPAPSDPGIYFYRIGIIHWNDSVDKRTAENGYIELWNDSSHIETNYNNKTDINKVSGYGSVTIP